MFQSFVVKQFKWLLVGAVIIAYGYICYLYGKGKVETKIIKQEVEVVKYVNKEICKIMAKPNLNNDDISKLFANDEL